MSWDHVEWNAKITNYEPIFGVDLDGDNYVGFNENNLESIETDTIGVKLLRDKSSGSLYILDGETRKLITDEYDWEPQLEYSNSWSDAWGLARTKLLLTPQSLQALGMQ